MLTLVFPVLLISKIVSYLYLIFINFSKVLVVKAGKIWASGECSSWVPSSSAWPADHLTPSDICFPALNKKENKRKQTVFKSLLLKLDRLAWCDGAHL